MDTWIRRRGTAERWHLVGSSLAPGLTSATCSTSFASSEDVVIWTGDDPPPELERCTPCQVTYWIGLAQLQQPVPEPSGYATLRSAAKRAPAWVRDGNRLYPRWHVRAKPIASPLAIAECGAAFHWTDELDRRPIDDPPPEPERCPVCHGAFVRGRAGATRRRADRSAAAPTPVRSTRRPRG